MRKLIFFSTKIGLNKLKQEYANSLIVHTDTNKDMIPYILETFISDENSTLLGNIKMLSEGWNCPIDTLVLFDADCIDEPKATLIQAAGRTR